MGAAMLDTVKPLHNDHLGDKKSGLSGRWPFKGGRSLI